MKSKSLHLPIILLLLFGSVGCNAPVASSPQGSEPTPTVSPTALISATSPSPMVTSSPVPEATSGLSSETATPAVTATHLQAICSNEAVFVLDLTIPDETVFSPGEVFTKSWRLKNTGSCNWTRDYGIVFSDGAIMDADEDLPMPVVVPPGESVDLTVQLTAPDQSGSYQSNWLLRDAEGATFGIGAGAYSPFWVSIIVITGLATPIADTPAAGICPVMEGEVVTMTINPDMPDPRCVVVHPDQHLRVVNGRDETLVVSLGRISATIESGDEHSFALPFGQLLLPGVHHLGVSPCCGGSIWLKEG